MCCHEPCTMRKQCRHRQALQPPAPQPSRWLLAPGPNLPECRTRHRRNSQDIGRKCVGSVHQDVEPTFERPAQSDTGRPQSYVLRIASSARGTCPKKVPQLRQLYVPRRASCNGEADDRTNLFLFNAHDFNDRLALPGHAARCWTAKPPLALVQSSRL